MPNMMTTMRGIPGGRVWVSPGGKPFMAPRGVAYRWFYLPYGQWSCPDGREVLFNRCYEPIWQRRPGEAPARADPKEWVKWEKQTWFYDDGHREKQKADRAKAKLAEWGLTE
jgi:hypothetical protein